VYIRDAPIFIPELLFFLFLVLIHYIVFLQ